MIDVEHQISAVERTVGDRVLEASAARVLTASQTYDATLDELWDACTSAERIPRWFMPISGDLRVGGRYQAARHRHRMHHRKRGRGMPVVAEDVVTHHGFVSDTSGHGRRTGRYSPGQPA
jgi:uncharacterized protein YndB with AHSA1/START domain